MSDYNKNCFTTKNRAVMLIQDDYYSPKRLSHKNSSRQTPKSILKEPSSASKSKKGIIINEKLNETRKLSLKCEANKAVDIEARIQGRNDYQSNNQKDSDLQSICEREQQRIREQEIYEKIIRRSNLNKKEANDINRESGRMNWTYQENEQLSNHFGTKKSLSKKYPKQNVYSLSNMRNVEEKIQQLEKCLDIYSKRLRDSLIRQKGQLLTSHHRNTMSNDLNNSKNTNSSSENHENNNKEPLQANKSQNIYSHSYNNPDDQNHSFKLIKHWEQLNKELGQLKQESNYLKSKFLISEDIWNLNVKQKNQDTSKYILNKEIELLNTIDDIRSKLSYSISKRSSIQEENRQFTTKSLFDTKSENTKIKESENMTKTANNIHARYSKLREAYGSMMLERENACFLDQGLSTTYNGFHWNVDHSLKLTRNI